MNFDIASLIAGAIIALIGSLIAMFVQRNMIRKEYNKIIERYKRIVKEYNAIRVIHGERSIPYPRDNSTRPLNYRDTRRTERDNLSSSHTDFDDASKTQAVAKEE